VTEVETSQVAALIAQIQALNATVQRLENLIEKKVGDLKTEQIADVKAAINRIADDQRRIWEAVRALERQASEQVRAIELRASEKVQALELQASGQGGAFRVIHGVAVFLGSVVTAIIMVTLGKLWR
jgi:hypothetical protein